MNGTRSYRYRKGTLNPSHFTKIRHTCQSSYSVAQRTELICFGAHVFGAWHVLQCAQLKQSKLRNPIVNSIRKHQKALAKL